MYMSIYKIDFYNNFCRKKGKLVLPHYGIKETEAQMI